MKKLKNYKHKTRIELIKELQELRQEYDSLKTSYSKDITGHKLIEKTLRESEEQYRLFFENSSEALMLTNQDGSVYSVNPEACRMLSWSKDEICKLGRTGIVDLNDKRLEPYLDERRKTGKFKGELNLIRKDGTKFPAEVTSIVFRDTSGNERTSMIIRDISERRQAEKELNLNSEIMKNISEGIFLIRLEEGVIVLTNPRFDEMFGYEHGEMIGKDVSIVNATSDKSPEETKQDILKIIDKTGEWHGEILNIKKNGDRFWCYANVSIFDHPDYGKVLLSIHSDITERKRNEEEIKKTHEQLKQLYMHQDELIENERTAISREIHDELGQSLSAIKIDLGWTKDNVGNEPEIKRKIKGMTEIVSDAIKRVQRISSDLRPGLLDDLGLVPAMEWYIQEFEKRTGIKCHFLSDDIQFSNESKNLTLYRILQEALTNVMRHANAKNVTLNLYPVEESIIMEIIDDGIGIMKEKIKSNKSLGLIGIRERVKYYNGSLDIYSDNDKGTKLSIRIPYNC